MVAGAWGSVALLEIYYFWSAGFGWGGGRISVLKTPYGVTLLDLHTHTHTHTPMTHTHTHTHTACQGGMGQRARPISMSAWPHHVFLGPAPIPPLARTIAIAPLTNWARTANV